MAQDYIVRMIQQIATVIAAILDKRRAGRIAEARAEIDRQCLEQTGLPMDLVRQVDPEMLDELLAAGGDTRVPKAILLAELLNLDGEMALEKGNPPAALLAFERAHRLLVGSIGSLSGDDKQACEDRLSELGAKLWDLGQGPPANEGAP